MGSPTTVPGGGGVERRRPERERYVVSPMGQETPVPPSPQ
jgi:hypothetical protein